MRQTSLWQPRIAAAPMQSASLLTLLRHDRWSHVLTFAIPADGFGWQRHRTSTMGRNGRPLEFALQYETDANAEWRYLVRASLAPFWRKPPIESGIPLSVVVDCAYDRPKAHRQSNGALRTEARHWKTSKPDADNVLKGVLDSMSTVVWHDDAQVVLPIPITRWTQPNETRRVLVSVFDLSACDEP